MFVPPWTGTECSACLSGCIARFTAHAKHDDKHEIALCCQRGNLMDQIPIVRVLSDEGPVNGPLL